MQALVVASLVGLLVNPMIPPHLCMGTDPDTERARACQEILEVIVDYVPACATCLLGDEAPDHLPRFRARA